MGETERRGERGEKERKERERWREIEEEAYMYFLCFCEVPAPPQDSASKIIMRYRPSTSRTISQNKHFLFKTDHVYDMTLLAIEVSLSEKAWSRP